MPAKVELGFESVFNKEGNFKKVSDLKTDLGVSCEEDCVSCFDPSPDCVSCFDPSPDPSPDDRVKNMTTVR